jgi:hypothetical protein
MDAVMFLQKLMNDLGSNVDFTLIPKQENRAADPVQQVLKKVHDFFSMNVAVRMKPDKEGKMPSLRRNADRRNGRQFFRMGCHRKNWGLAFRRPRSSDIWRKEKAAFIEENQVCLKLFSFFLYGAKHDPSNPEFAVRPFRVLSWQAFDNSNSIPALTARHGSYDTEPQKGVQLSLQYASMSIVPLENLQPMRPCLNSAAIFSFDTGSFLSDGLKWASVSNPPFLSLCRCDAIVRLSLMNNPAIWQQHGDSSRFATKQRLFVFAILTAYLFVWVSYPKINILVKNCTHSL